VPPSLLSNPAVISPDVYLNGGEIGVPPYFAARLSFPERVTAWNVERLREAVIAGPGRNPGAVAVEDARGRMVLLRGNKEVGGLGLGGCCLEAGVKLDTWLPFQTTCLCSSMVYKHRKANLAITPCRSVRR
jgi:DNA-directed RNA polymerase beta' subunit